jgi:16S rRNA (guanine(966)-N(2))-methyltransferase RsmD
VRIIGGSFGGTVLSSPKGNAVRPTSEKAREALFNIIGPRIEGSSFLDLYGGSGAVGLEALSRGAAHVTIVEASRIDLIRKNSAKCGVTDPERFNVIRGGVFKAARAMEKRGEIFDFVFADPPWHEGLEAEAVNCAVKLLKEGGGFILEAHHKTKPPAPPEGASQNPRLEESRRYGDTVLHFYRF